MVMTNEMFKILIKDVSNVSLKIWRLIIYYSLKKTKKKREMIKRFALVLFIILMQAPPAMAEGNLILNKYDKAYGSAKIISNFSIKHMLKMPLVEKYDNFIGGFNIFDKPEKKAGNGLLIERWLKELYFEGISAFVSYPNIGLYAARLV